MSVRHQFNLFSLDTQQSEPIINGFVVRYKVDEERVALRFDVQPDGVFVIFEGGRGFPIHNDNAIPPATPTRVKEGDRLTLGNKHYRIILAEAFVPQDTTTDFELRDIWSEEYLSRRSERSRIVEAIPLTGMARILGSAIGDRRFSIFAFMQLGMFVATVLSLSFHSWPANIMVSVSVVLWLAFFLIALIFTFHLIWNSPPEWMNKGLAWTLIFLGPLAPHLLIMVISLLFGSRHLGFPSSSLFSGDNYSLGASKTKHILFPNDWYYIILRPEGRLPAQAAPSSRKYQVSAERLASLLDELFKVKFESGLCRDPLLLSACYQFDANRCKKSLNDSHTKCSIQTASRSWEMKDIPDAARGNISCLMQTITHNQSPDMATAKCEKTIRSAVQKVIAMEGDPVNMLKVLSLTQILNLVEESEAQYQWCGRHGIIGSCSQLLYADCKKMIEPNFESCRSQILTNKNKDARIPIDRALSIVEDFRTCTMNELLRSVDFSRVNPHCFLTLFKAGDQ